MKKRIEEAKERFNKWKASLATIYMDMFAEHPFLLGVIEGQIFVYWFIVLAALIVSIIKRKRFVWTLVEK